MIRDRHILLQRLLFGELYHPLLESRYQILSLETLDRKNWIRYFDFPIYDVIQDKKDRIYLATYYGVYVFDGKDWQKFDIGWAKVLLDGCLDFAFGDIWIGTLNGAYKFSKKDSFVLCIKFCIQHYKTIIFFEDKHIYILKIRLIS